VLLILLLYHHHNYYYSCCYCWNNDDDNNNNNNRRFNLNRMLKNWNHTEHAGVCRRNMVHLKKLLTI
jgi:hypothetical protein